MPKLIDTTALFEVTTTLFAERGYAALTTQEVALRAGINEATIYRRYGTKAGLVVAALTEQLASTPFAGVSAGADAEADLLALVGAFGETTRMLGGAVATLLTEASRHPELRSAMPTLLANLGAAASVLRAHQEKGNLAEGDPMQQLVLLLSPVLAAGLWARSGVDAPAEVGAAAVVTGFLDGHRRR